MKITQDVRDFAASLDANEIAQGMADKAAEFVETGSEIYHEV